ncbi:MAG: type II toxin-antitoxin system VapC family toxin [Gaiellaceae bacterium]
MILPDANVLVYAHREDADGHQEYREWLLRTIDGAHPYGVSDVVLSGFLRVVTHPRIFVRPSPLVEAVAFCDVVRSNGTAISPGRRHWQIFTRLCTDVGARGNVISDAFLAAMAIETNSEWITTDRDFRRFAGLRVRHPFD